jgi:hypothetical protein
LRAEADRTGRSQQDLIRTALDQYLGLGIDRPAAALDRLIAAGSVKPARGPLRQAIRLIELPPGVSSLDLLDREDRL